jgi:hypothetical protein
MTSYECKRCNYKSQYFSDVKRHLNKKKKCLKSINVIKYSNDQLFAYSLIPLYENTKSIDIESIKPNPSVYINKDKLFNIIITIDKNKSKICPYCNKSFDKIQDNKNHVISECFSENGLKNDVDNNLNIINNNNTINNIDTVNNNTIDTLNNNIVNNNVNNNVNNTIDIINNTLNATNIFNITVNLVPFDKEWDITKIDNYKKEQLVFSNIMYTNLLEEILNNETNLNVIIDKETCSGMVYKNEVDKYIQMKIKDIVEKSMEKLYNKLNEINGSMSKNSMVYEDILKLSKEKINNKYTDYKNNEETKKIVQDYITNIFDNKKENAIVIANNIDQNNIIKGGF